MTGKEKESYYKGLNDGIDIMTTELAKYKRAFEILKDRLSLYVQDYEYPDKQNRYWIARTYDFGSTQITQEEYELLEELMSDGKVN